MGDDGSHPFLVGVGGEVGIIEQCSLPVGDQAPVLHGTSIEVWERNLICIQMEKVCRPELAPGVLRLALAPKHSCRSSVGFIILLPYRRRVSIEGEGGMVLQSSWFSCWLLHRFTHGLLTRFGQRVADVIIVLKELQDQTRLVQGVVSLFSINSRLPGEDSDLDVLHRDVRGTFSEELSASCITALIPE